MEYFETPGVKLLISPGTYEDYRALERFHYRSDRPATWADIRVVKDRRDGAVIAVGVLSFPVPALRERDEHFGLASLSRARRIEFVNANLRTISRVIVHPHYRSLGLAARLVRHLCESSPTRWVEAIAMMGKAHPFFERAGMKRLGRDDPNRPAWFLWDRVARASRPWHESPDTDQTPVPQKTQSENS